MIGFSLDCRDSSPGHQHGREGRDLTGDDEDGLKLPVNVEELRDIARLVSAIAISQPRPESRSQCPRKHEHRAQRNGRLPDAGAARSCEDNYLRCSSRGLKFLRARSVEETGMVLGTVSAASLGSGVT